MPHTPFSGVTTRAREVQDILRDLKERLRKPGMKLKWNLAGHSVFEAVFARGDRRLGAALKRAWELGARFDGWTDRFDEGLWYRAMADTGLDAPFYAQRERGRDEILPWDHLSAGVSREYLWQEYQRALDEKFTPDCRRGGCTGCGVCDHEKISPVVYEGPVPALQAGGPERVESGRRDAVASDEAGFLYRIIYSKLDRARFFGSSNCDGDRARVRRTGLPAAYSKGLRPH